MGHNLISGGQSSRGSHLDFISYWADKTVEEAVLQGHELRLLKAKPVPSREYDVVNINFIKSPCSVENSRRRRKRSAKVSTKRHRSKSPIKRPQLTNVPKRRKRHKSKLSCGLRIAELAVPTKRHCLETWKNKYNTLPDYMIERLRQHVLDQRPVVHISDAIHCFQRKCPRLKQNKKDRSGQKAVERAKNSLRKNEVKVFSAIFGSKISKKLIVPRNLILNTDLEKIADVISYDIGRLMKKSKRIDTRNKMYKNIERDIVNKITIWVAGVLEETKDKILEDQLKDFEEEAGPALDCVDSLLDNVLDICIPIPEIFEESFVSSDTEASIKSSLEESISSEEIKIEDHFRNEIDKIIDTIDKGSDYVEAEESNTLEEVGFEQVENEETSDTNIKDIEDLHREADAENEDRERVSNVSEQNENPEANNEGDDDAVLDPSETVHSAPIGAKDDVAGGATDGAADDAIDGATETVHSAPIGTKDDVAGGAADGAADDAIDGATDDVIDDATVGATDGAPDGVTDGATDGATLGVTVGTTDIVIEETTDGATGGTAVGVTDDSTDGTTVGTTDDATDETTASATDRATDGATVGATDEATEGPTVRATDGATDVATDGATEAGTAVATDDATAEATDDATEIFADATDENAPISEGGHNADISFNWKASIEHITFAEPNETLLSDADETWPDDVPMIPLRPSQSVSKSVTSLGNINEVEESASNMPEVEESKDVKKKSSSDDKTLEEEPQSAANDDRKSTASARFKRDVSKASLHKDSKYVNRIISDSKKPKRPIKKPTPSPQQKSPSKTSKVDESSTRNSTAIKIPKKPKDKDIKSKNKDTVSTRTIKSTKLLKDIEASVKDDKPPIKKKMDYRVNTKTAPAWINRNFDESSCSCVQIPYKSKGKPKLNQNLVKIWCKDLEQGYENLKMWNEWVENTTKTVCTLQKEIDKSFCPGRCSNKEWVKLKRNIDKDAYLWIKLNKQTQQRLKSYKTMYSKRSDNTSNFICCSQTK